LFFGRERTDPCRRPMHRHGLCVACCATDLVVPSDIWGGAWILATRWDRRNVRHGGTSAVGGSVATGGAGGTGGTVARPGPHVAAALRAAAASRAAAARQLGCRQCPSTKHRDPGGISRAHRGQCRQVHNGSHDRRLLSGRRLGSHLFAVPVRQHHLQHIRNAARASGCNFIGWDYVVTVQLGSVGPVFVSAESSRGLLSQERPRKSTRCRGCAAHGGATQSRGRSGGIRRPRYVLLRPAGLKVTGIRICPGCGCHEACHGLHRRRLDCVRSTGNAFGVGVK